MPMPGKVMAAVGAPEPDHLEPILWTRMVMESAITQGMVKVRAGAGEEKAATVMVRAFVKVLEMEEAKLQVKASEMEAVPIL